MAILKHLDAATGLRAIEDIRLRFLELEWFERVTQDLPRNSLEGMEGKRPISVSEIMDNVTDLILIYRFADQRCIVGKVFLPVVKTKPWLGFRGLDDRGKGIDCRMLLAASVSDDTQVRIPKPYLYDERHRVLWMEFIPGALRTLSVFDWEWALELLAPTIARIHTARISDDLRPRIENAQFRASLIAYPASFIEPYLSGPRFKSVWEHFRRLDSRAVKGLIHGDLKSGNICISDSGIWLLDFERSNLANPAYDLGFLLCHLIIDAWDSSYCGALPMIERFIGVYAKLHHYDASFEFCVMTYVALFLVYRTKASDVLHLKNPVTLAAIQSAVELSVEHCGSCSLQGYLQMIFDHGEAAKVKAEAEKWK